MFSEACRMYTLVSLNLSVNTLKNFFTDVVGIITS
jgi:hypothetical protein